MPNVLIVYFSHGGNTRLMAEALAQGLQEKGVAASLKTVSEATAEDLARADGVLLGSPCYFGGMAADMKRFVDDSIKLFGKGELVGKPGGAFCSTGGIGGGGETTIISLLTAMLIHGMVIQGLRKGGHFGPLAIGQPDERVMNECRAYADQFAGLVKKLAG